MSNQVFPLSLPGFDIKVSRTPVYSTKIQTAASGKELRSAWWAAPRFRYALTLNFLRQAGFSVNTLADEVATMAAFFQAHLGMWDSFWLSDPMAINQIPNPTSEEANPTGYGALNISTNTAYTGSKSRRLLSSGVGVQANLTITDLITCTAGDQFYGESRVWNDAGNRGMISVVFVDAGGNTLSGADSSWITGTAWDKATVIATAPANAANAYFVLRAYRTSGAGAGATYHDNLFGARLAHTGLTVATDETTTRIKASSDGLRAEMQRRVRFDMDEMEMERMFDRVWDGKQINLISVK